MQDLKNLFYYGTGTLVVILVLSNLSSLTESSGGVIVVLALLLVVFLPVYLSIKAVKRKNAKDQ